jgi:diguanylate cyclase (GGDEF)-like protein
MQIERDFGERRFQDAALMARVMPAVWLGGSAMFLAVVLSGGTDAGSRTGFLVLDAIAWTVFAVMAVGGTRLPAWFWELSQYLGIAIVSALVIVGDDAASPFALFYLWLAVQSAFFEDWRRLIPQVVLAGGGYAVALATVQDGFPVVRWVMLVASLVVVGWVVAYMRARVELLIVRLGKAAETDELTGLPNRRRLLGELDAAVAPTAPEAALAMFDLDGFKGYNDTFGHPAGDALLARVAERLAASVTGAGTAFRLGGDEFCVIAHGEPEGRESAIARAGEALCESGEGFDIQVSFGVVRVPDEARTVADALRLVDRRLYQAKGAGREGAKAWARAFVPGWTSVVAPRLGTRLGLVGEELEILARAAQLHDIGKVAIPRELLLKTGPLSVEELDYIRRHVVIGERVLHGAEPLVPVARVVRATHERWDGEGYPDGLAGEAIPLAARVVAVCEAFESMTTGRGYRPPVPAASALAELRRCSGTQFDSRVVDELDRFLAEAEEEGEVKLAPAPR